MGLHSHLLPQPPKPPSHSPQTHCILHLPSLPLPARFPPHFLLPARPQAPRQLFNLSPVHPFNRATGAAANLVAHRQTPSFPTIGKLFSNGWKKWHEFSNDWKNFSGRFRETKRTKRTTKQAENKEVRQVRQCPTIVFYIENHENRFADRNAWIVYAGKQLGQPRATLSKGAAHGRCYATSLRCAIWGAAFQPCPCPGKAKDKGSNGCPARPGPLPHPRQVKIYQGARTRPLSSRCTTNSSQATSSISLPRNQPRQNARSLSRVFRHRPPSNLMSLHTPDNGLPDNLRPSTIHPHGTNVS